MFTRVVSFVLGINTMAFHFITKQGDGCYFCFLLNLICKVDILLGIQLFHWIKIGIMAK